MAQKANQYQAFNKFQTAFFTSIAQFSRYTDWEINQHSFMLFNNITKVFPSQGVKFQFYNQFCKFNECPSIIRALQHRYVNNFVRARIPKEIYYRQGKKIAKSKKKNKKVNEGIEFSDEIRFEIQSILMMDSKTYGTLKTTKRVQELGEHLMNKNIQTNEKYSS